VLRRCRISHFSPEKQRHKAFFPIDSRRKRGYTWFKQKDEKDVLFVSEAGYGSIALEPRQILPQAQVRMNVPVEEANVA
jgi:hypothetical protein